MKRIIGFLFVYFLITGYSAAGTFMPSPFGLNLGSKKAFSSNIGGYVFYIGDMKFFSTDFSAQSVVTNRWPNGILYIEFDSNVTSANRQRFLNACLEWQDAGVRCTERTTEPNFYRVVEHSGDGCGNIPNAIVSCAPLGFQVSGMSIEIHELAWNSSRTVAHEIGHAFGLIHEHSRADRDLYVTINLANAQPGSASQFGKIETEISTDYDYESVMHYFNCAFSIHSNCTSSEADIPLQTIFVNGCGLPNAVGGFQVSPLDIDTLRAAYNPALTAAFGSRRSLTCGQTSYTKSQVAALCSDGSCTGGSVEPVQWIKYNEISGSDCGFAPIRDYPAMCNPKGQEYIRHWFDKDPCSCHICSTRFEWWVACGCSVQSAQSKCTDFGTPMTAEKALELANSGDPKFAAVGALINKLWVMTKSGAAEPIILERFGLSIAKNLSDPEFEPKYKKLSASIRILSAARIQQVQDLGLSWQLSDDIFRQFHKRVGLYDKY